MHIPWKSRYNCKGTVAVASVSCPFMTGKKEPRIESKNLCRGNKNSSGRIRRAHKRLQRSAKRLFLDSPLSVGASLAT